MKTRYTKIICTLGPSSSDESMISKMAGRGMDVARINFSHGTSDQHEKMINAVRSGNEKHGFNVGLVCDLSGFRIRIGELKRRKTLTQNALFTMSGSSQDNENHIPFDFKGDLDDIKRGFSIFIDDGYLHLKVMAHSGGQLKVKVIQGGVLKSRKGINIPDLKLQSNLTTQKDKDDIEFAVKHRVDMIAQSFVRDKKDIERVRDLIKPRLPDCKIIAKIENQDGLRNIEKILKACDGVMAGRGDLGVTMPIYKIPIIQKYIIRHCNRCKKVSITATQMLDSMIEHGRPTRAEVSDVANAILDGSDYVMLSGETAIGKFPSRSIKLMSQIVEYTEKYNNLRP